VCVVIVTGVSVFGDAWWWFLCVGLCLLCLLGVDEVGSVLYDVCVDAYGTAGHRNNGTLIHCTNHVFAL